MMAKHPRAVNWFLRRVFQIICKIDGKDFKKLPRRGPFIMVGNHVNFLETPVFVAHYDHPDFTGMAKKDSWKNPLFHFLFDQWGIIPIDRNLVDREAFVRSTQALNNGAILAISPEGTRSGNGCLQVGKPGVVALALRSQAPILPVAFYGYENFWDNLKHLRRTEFHLAVGKPFRIKTSEKYLSREARQIVTDEIMYKIAELLPAKYRGYYQFEGPVQYQYVSAD